MPIFDIANANACMTDNEKFLLALCAATLPSGSVVAEVGAFLGGSAEIMLCVAGERITLHSMDIEDRVPAEFKQRHANYHFHLERGSAFARREDLAMDMLFIDGDHSFSGVQEDTEAFWPRLKDGAMLVAHDALSMQHLGVRTYIETLFDNGCLTRPARADTMLVGCVDKSNPLPAPADFARVAYRLLQLGWHSPNWLSEHSDPNHFLAHAMVARPELASGAHLVGRGKRGDFVARFLGQDPALLINSWDARDPDAKYYVCSNFYDKIFTHLVWYAKVSPRNIYNVSPGTLSRWVKDDILHNGAARLLGTYQRENERAVLAALLPLLSEPDVHRLCEIGMLHDFFVCFPASFPPLDQQ